MIVQKELCKNRRFTLWIFWGRKCWLS